jgi:hypothetical protein
MTKIMQHFEKNSRKLEILLTKIVITSSAIPRSIHDKSTMCYLYQQHLNLEIKILFGYFHLNMVNRKAALLSWYNIVLYFWKTAVQILVRGRYFLLKSIWELDL